tara:strand:- start:762 stop:992 length:231 start_codon:yes stop_codon:yes gene_type:complete
MSFTSSDYNTLNFLKNELEYLNLNAEKFQRLQRKNAKEYLRLRIESLEQYQTDSEQADKIIKKNNDSDSTEQKNTE